MWFNSSKEKKQTDLKKSGRGRADHIPKTPIQGKQENNTKTREVGLLLKPYEVWDKVIRQNPFLKCVACKSKISLSLLIKNSSLPLSSVRTQQLESSDLCVICKRSLPNNMDMSWCFWMCGCERGLKHKREIYERARITNLRSYA